MQQTKVFHELYYLKTTTKSVNPVDKSAEKAGCSVFLGN